MSQGKWQSPLKYTKHYPLQDYQISHQFQNHKISPTLTQISIRKILCNYTFWENWNSAVRFSDFFSHFLYLCQIKEVIIV